MKQSGKFTLIALIVSAFLLVWGKPMLSPNANVNLEHRLTYDVFGYYLYLPATFIYNDPGITDKTWLLELFDTYKPSGSIYQIFQGKENRQYIKYSMGMAVLYLPFFLIAHFFALFSNFPADGFSYPYQFAISIGSYIYAFIGLVFISKVLRKYFSDGITAIALLLLFFGTNYLQIASNNTHTAHPYLFTLYAIVLWLTIRWQEKNLDFKAGRLLFFAFGLACLARPSSILLGFIILLYGVNSKATFKERLALLKTRKKELYKYFGILFLVALPQLLYWQYTTGQPIIYSYPNDGFDFTTPYFKEILFGYRNGWLRYTPFMFIPIAGLFVIYKYYKNLAWAIPVFFVFNLYLISSWNAWWFGGAYGNRGFVESYAVMMLPLAAMLTFIQQKKWIIKLGFATLVLALCALNLFQTWQINNGLLDANYMTKNYYWAVFGKTHTTPEIKKQLALERGAKTFDKLEYQLVAQKNMLPFFEMHQSSFNLNAETVVFDTVVYNLTHEEHLWIVADVTIFSKEPLQEWSTALALETNHKDKNIKSKKFWFRQGKNGLYHFHIEYLTPMLKAAKRDYFRTYFRNPGKVDFEIKNFTLQFYEPTYFWDYRNRKSE